MSFHPESMKTPLRVLIVEDSDDDAMLLVRELERAGYELVYRRVETADEFAAALDRESWELVCADYTLPGFFGTDALAMVHEKGLDVPFIFVSATMGEEVAVGAMKAGAHDYVLKDDLTRLAPAVVRELREARLREERAKLEADLLQAQRLESIGRLAGGVAHDLNNLLTVIGGHVELILMDTPPDSSLGADLGEVRQAVRRAMSLIQQLLAFSRRQVLEIRVLDLNEIISTMERMFHRVLHENVELVTELAPDLAPVEADAGQLEQVLMNLILNARDAMPEGGRIHVTTSNAMGPPAEGEGPPQPSVRVVVRDTGAGMDPATRDQIFEPFFTTKAPGEGTGLGLPTSYGIVTQLGGRIQVESRPGHGSTFTVVLPAAPDGPAREKENESDAVESGGTRGRGETGGSLSGK